MNIVSWCNKLCFKSCFSSNFKDTHTHTHNHWHKGVEREREKVLTLAGLLAKCPQWLSQIWPRTEADSQVSCMGGRNPTTWVITTASYCLLWQEINQELQSGTEPRKLTLDVDILISGPHVCSHVWLTSVILSIVLL